MHTCLCGGSCRGAIRTTGRLVRLSGALRGSVFLSSCGDVFTGSGRGGPRVLFDLGCMTGKAGRKDAFGAPFKDGVPKLPAKDVGNS